MLIAALFCQLNNFPGMYVKLAYQVVCFDYFLVTLFGESNLNYLEVTFIPYIPGNFKLVFVGRSWLDCAVIYICF